MGENMGAVWIVLIFLLKLLEIVEKDFFSWKSLEFQKFLELSKNSELNVCLKLNVKKKKNTKLLSS